MQGRTDWQALQARLAAARAAASRGDRETALAEIAAALELDPDFLAAHALRDRLLAEGLASAPAATAPEVSPAADVSTESYDRFEQRTKRRRLEKRMEAARDAIKHGRTEEAAAALDEVIELDPALPELFALTEAFDTLRRGTPAHRGPWLAAAAAFACTILGGSLLQESSFLMSHPVITAGMLLPVALPTATVSTEVPAAGTSDERQPIAAAAADEDVARSPIDLPTPTPAARMAVESSQPALQLPPSLVPPPRPAPTDGARSLPPIEAAAQPSRTPAIRSFDGLRVAPATVETREPEGTPSDRSGAESNSDRVALPEPLVDESALVNKALQRYRVAYEQLDAQSARAVWPAVNQAALARAFDGLESQTLTFDACDVRVSGEAASATCHGSARYVPKIGSREPRVEPRVWTFTLRKNGGDWRIDSARAER